jgi:hypothetical protein
LRLDFEKGPIHPSPLGPSILTAGDDHYEHVGHQQDSRISRQENWMVRNPKLDGSISQEAASAPGHRHEQDALKDGPSADELENS